MTATTTFQFDPQGRLIVDNIWFDPRFSCPMLEIDGRFFRLPSDPRLHLQAGKKEELFRSIAPIGGQPGEMATKATDAEIAFFCRHFVPRRYTTI